MRFARKWSGRFEPPLRIWGGRTRGSTILGYSALKVNTVNSLGILAAEDPAITAMSVNDAESVALAKAIGADKLLGKMELDKKLLPTILALANTAD
jgi:hypothetical protein